MKKQLLLLPILFLIAGCLLPGCTKSDSNLVPYTYYKPFYKSKAAVRANIKSSAATPISQAGKIFIQGNNLFMVDLNKGVHIIDITNISQPQNIAFIPVPGCNDIAVRGNYLYVDFGQDLLTIDISNPVSAFIKKSVSKVFPENYALGYSPDTSKVFAGYQRVDTVFAKHFKIQNLLYDNANTSYYYGSASSTSASSAFGATTTNGTGGSMSRFGLLNDRMYAVSYYDLKVFNTTEAANPTFIKKLTLSQGSIETIFPYGDNLFIGSQSGMFIYNASNPDDPAKLAQFTHVRSCDPVIADENTAYVTLHGGTSCGGFSNQLDVLDITKLTSPVLVKTYALTSPRGLSKDGKLLFICDGKDGLKIFDATKADQILPIKTVPDIDAQDVIVYKKTAIVTATGGLYFIDYTDPANAKITSSIQIHKTE